MKLEDQSRDCGSTGQVAPAEALCAASERMVRLDEVTLNRFFKTLSDWEQILQAENIDFAALEAAQDDESSSTDQEVGS